MLRNTEGQDRGGDLHSCGRVERISVHIEVCQDDDAYNQRAYVPHELGDGDCLSAGRGAQVWQIRRHDQSGESPVQKPAASCQAGG